ncbi:MAG: ATP synthase F0 subunit C [Acidobacteriota bacterium]
MSNREKIVITLVAVILFFNSFVFAEEVEGKKPSGSNALIIAVIVSIAGLALSAMVGGIAQSNAIRSAFDGISRNPGAAGPIRVLLLLGLVFIESLVIYVLFINIIIYFVRWKDLISY